MIDWKLVLQLAGIVLGLLYLWLEYRANIWLWAVSIVMPVVHGVLYYRSGLYADMAMNVYYVIAGFYGWIVWLRGSGGKSDKLALRISSTPWRLGVILTVVGAVVWAAIYFILVRYTDSTVPVLDSLTTAMSIVALWMLSRKYLEQWLVWLAVDAISCGLYIYKGIPFTAGLYGLYTILAVAGYMRWRRVMLSEQAAAVR